MMSRLAPHLVHRILAALATPLLIAATVAVPAPATSVPAWQTAPTSWTNPTGGQPRITGLRYATHATFDRVVIDVAGKMPSYRTHYDAKFYYDASGAQVPIRGGLGITFHPASAHSNGSSTYTGPQIARPGFPTLKAIAFTGDFEGYVNFAFGLSCNGSTKAPYRVMRLHEPQRVVVDFKHC